METAAATPQSARMPQSSAEPPTARHVHTSTVHGLPVHMMDTEATLDYMAGAIAQARATAQRQPARQIVTLNPEIVMEATRHADLRTAILSADLVVPDGAGIIWATRLRGEPVPARVTGVDLLDAFAKRAARDGYRLFLLGGRQGVAAAAALRLQQRYPNLAIAGTHTGSPADSEAPGILARISAAHTDVLFVAFGSPAQECWIARHRGQLGAAVAVGVGGALDFISGRVPRAPRWMRRLGIEWVYRLWREPWRWRRMLALPHFALVVIADMPRAWTGLTLKTGVRRGRL